MVNPVILINMRKINLIHLKSTVKNIQKLNGVLLDLWGIIYIFQILNGMKMLQIVMFGNLLEILFKHISLSGE